MEITVFAKKRNTTDGRVFYTYLSTLTKKDGSTVTTQVKFRDSAGKPNPEECPMNIKFDKTDANFTSKDRSEDVVDEDTGEVTSKIVTSRTLWIAKWSKGSPYVDTSMDDFV